MMKDLILTFIAVLYDAFYRRNKVLVLTIHRVGVTRGMPVSAVKQQLKYLAQNYKVEFSSRIDLASLSRKTAIITLDDCHEDVYEYIFPVVYDLGLPITICIPTDFFFHRKWLWFDKVLWGLDHIGLRKEIRVGTNLFRTDLTNSHKAILKHLKSMHTAERDMRINQMFSEIGVSIPTKPAEGFRPVRLSDMRKMIDTNLVEIASHSVSHPILTSLTEDELEAEVTSSKQELEVFCGQEISSFCYPNGLRGDFDTRTRKALIKAGYKLGFTSIEGLNFLDDIDLMQLNRLHIQSRVAVFKKMASGMLYTGLKRRGDSEIKSI